jgi:hypothetical protein
MTFARTARGYAEAVDGNSALSPMLRHLLILLDGKSTLTQLSHRYHHGDICLAASLLWVHGYAQLQAPQAQHEKRSLVSRLFGRDDAAQAGAAPGFVDSLQSVFPTTMGSKADKSRKTAVQFTESGRYWFSLGGITASRRHPQQGADAPPASDGSDHHLPKHD